MNHDERATATGGDILNLAEILNILWRRRVLVFVCVLLGLLAGVVYVIVTPPLYRATATVRPGITGYNANGIPRRDWHLKDIVRWYRRDMYAQGLRAKMGWEPGRPVPRILAEFIPRSVGVQGGDVVTLTTLHVDGPEATALLDSTVIVFNEYAELNNVGSNIALSRKDLLAQIDQLANDRDNVDVKKAILDIEIARSRQELAQLEVEEQKLELEILEHDAQQRRRADKAGRLGEGVADARESLGEMDGVLDRLREKEARESERDSVISRVTDIDELPFLWWEMAQDKTAVAGRMLLSTLDMQARMWTDELEAVDLEHEQAIAELAHEADLLQKRFDLTRRRALVELTIEEKTVNRDRALAQEVVDIDDQINLLRSRLDVLTSLEKIGFIDATTNPVRPRKARAMGILLMAGLIGGVVLAFVWEYGTLNRKVIFRD